MCFVVSAKLSGENVDFVTTIILTAMIILVIIIPRFETILQQGKKNMTALFKGDKQTDIKPIRYPAEEKMIRKPVFVKNNIYSVGIGIVVDVFGWFLDYLVEIRFPS